MRKFSVEDVANLNVGEKVTIVSENSSQKFSTYKGTITKITPKTVTIRQYRKQNHSYVVKVGESFQIVKGWSVSPEAYRNQFETLEYHEIDGFIFEGDLVTGKVTIMFNGKEVDQFWNGGIKNNKEEFINRCQKTYNALAETYRKAI